MQLIIGFGPDGDILEVPNIVIEKLADYNIQFQKWIFDKSIVHSYWMYNEGSEKCGCHFRSEAFVEWLNTNPLKNSERKAKLISRSLPMLHF